MKSIRDTEQIYENCKTLTVKRVVASFPELMTFSNNLLLLDKELKEELNHDFWEEIMIPLKRYSFNLLSSPLNSNYISTQNPDFLDFIEKKLKQCEVRFPRYLRRMQLVRNGLHDLVNAESNPYLNLIKENIVFAGRTSLVLVNQRSKKQVEEILSNSEINVDVRSVSELRKITSRDCLLYIGSTRWLGSPAPLFESPRTKNLTVIQYPWLTFNINTDQYMISNHAVCGYKYKEKQIFSSRTEQVTEEITNQNYSIEDNRILKIANARSENHSLLETVEAKLFRLSDNHCIFLESESDSPQIVITRSENERNIKQIPSKYLRKGMYLVVKDSETGDYIEEAANSILGKKAKEARDAQAHWKKLLLQKAKAEGLFSTSLNIINCGSTIANEMNVRNWLSPRSIRTRDKKDFIAILNHINLAGESELYWELMRAISNAHVKAGFEVKKELLQVIQEDSINDLEHSGQVEIALKTAQIKLHIYKIENISENTVSIPYSMLGTPIDLERFLWRE